MNPISIFCPVTNRSVTTGIETDWSTYFELRHSRLRVRCPHCGGEHDVPVRESFMARSQTGAELDGGRPPDNAKIDDLIQRLGVGAR